MARSGIIALVATLVVAAGGAWLLVRSEALRGEEPPRPMPPPWPAPAPVAPKAAPALVAARPVPVDLRWLAFAGGATPEFNQVSLEQDLGLVRETFGPQGYVLFGAGAGSPSVQVLAEHEPDPLRATLADLFAPRGGRDSSYRAPQTEVDGPATATAVRDALTKAVAEPGEPLWVWIGGHGRQGPTARDNVTDLWGSGELRVDEVAEILDGARRPVRVVSTTCFGGGLGELAFAGADPSRGAATTVRCGVFAAPWDLEATGCDPNPDRGAQEGYALHVLHALAGKDRGGAPVPLTELDLDGDGKVSLLEAHTRARLFAKTADVPTTTSERWLRQVAPERGDGREYALPEEEAVIRTLARRLGMDGREADAHLQLEGFEARIEEIAKRLDDARAVEDEAFVAASADLLARWPVLDDPWHPQFAETLEVARPALQEHLETSATFRAYKDAVAVVNRETTALWDLRAEAAPYERLARAVDNRRLAARLHARGGPDWDTYETLLRCERSTLP